MYVPAHFAMTEAEAAEMLSGITVADLITAAPAGLVASFLPWIYEPSTHSLLGHVARTNEHWRHAGADSMVIAHGPDAYVSPSAYPSKAEHGRVVPTWNYTTVHLYGPLRVHDDARWLRDLVSRLTDRFEAERARPWSIADAPQRFLDGQLRAIVGVELQIERIEAKSKLSQNRSEDDQRGVIADLRSRGPRATEVAEAMSAQQR